MSEMLPTPYIARHGETVGNLSGQHTGLTDLPLTKRGQSNARHLGNQLRGRFFANVFTSPLQRAHRRCELAGFGAQVEVNRDLVEWNYGEYEGLRTQEIRAKRPGWKVFSRWLPRGESVGEVGARAGRVVDRVRALHEDVLIFSSGHFVRVLAACWLGLEPQAGFLLSTASGPTP